MTPGHETDPAAGGPPSEGGPRARTPAGFAIAVSLVSLMLVAGVAIAAAVMVAGGHEPVMRAAPDSIELASMPHRTAEHYRFAAAHAGVYEQVPCFCGCEAMLEHRSLLDCFVRPEGGWERHASACAVCLDESGTVRSMLARGSPTEQIRSEIVAAYTTGV